MRYDIYMNPFGTFASVQGARQGSAGRTGFDTYNGITGGTLLLRGQSVAGGSGAITNGVDVLDEHAQHLSRFATSSGFGVYATRINLTGGAWSDNFVSEMSIGCSIYANDGSGMGSTIGNWTTFSEDAFRVYYMSSEQASSLFDIDYDGPIRMAVRFYDMTTIYASDTVIPEPVTMSLLAVGGLALLRRRRG